MKWLFALLLTGCLQGGEEKLDGTWATRKDDACGCLYAATFGPGDQVTIEQRKTLYSGEPADRFTGTYTADADTLHLSLNSGLLDMKYRLEPVVGILTLEWGINRAWLFWVKPL